MGHVWQERTGSRRDSFYSLCLRIAIIAGLLLASLLTQAQMLKSVVYSFDGLDIGQTNLPEADYKQNDLVYKIAANPLGNSDMLGDRVLQLDLTWNKGTGIFGRSISRFIEMDPATDRFNFYIYNPQSNAGDALVDVAITEDDDQSNSFSITSDDVWIKSLTLPRSAGWQLVSIPLKDFRDSNAGGNGIFDATFTGARGMILMVELRFKRNSTANVRYYVDMLCFSDGNLPSGATVLDLPANKYNHKCPLGAFESKGRGLQYLIPGEVEGFFPAGTGRKLKYVNYFIQFAMDGSTTAKELPGDEVNKLQAAGYTPIITWEPMFQQHDRLDPVQPRLANIIRGD